MGQRSWLIPIAEEADAVAVKRWLLNCERDAGTDYGLRVWSVVRRLNGSIWAMVESSGSGCIREMERYGYSPTGVKLLGEMPSWDDETGALGAFGDALHSAYLDAKEQEFFGRESLALKDQQGSHRIFLCENMGAVLEARKHIEQVAATLEPRLVPEVSGVLYSIDSGRAKLFGIGVARMDVVLLSEIRRQVGLNDIDAADAPCSVKLGFVCDERDQTVTVRVGEGYREYPLAGAALGEGELAQIAHSNSNEQFEDEVAGAADGLGMRCDGRSGSAQGRTATFSKLLDGDLGGFYMRVEAAFSSDGSQGGHGRRITVRLDRASWSDRVPFGKPQIRVLHEASEIERAVSEMIGELKLSLRG